MTFQTVYDGLAGILRGLELQEASQTFEAKNLSTEEYEKTFILTPLNGEAGEANDTQAALLYDNQVWTIQIAYSKGSQAELEQLKAMHRKRDEVMVALDNPTNWLSFASIVRYISWEVANDLNYYVLKINIRVINPLNY